ncbi:hypothetical protein [Labrenzia sp. VG12]|uniref:hypothetical protein n=1 Tax=Labrenzia sp. VG12 TaxID=2021862 RepID=UPI0012FD724E|nr:hypothetical protein [Labrenzia sp. VG12]
MRIVNELTSTYVQQISSTGRGIIATGLLSFLTSLTFSNASLAQTTTGNDAAIRLLINNVEALTSKQAELELEIESVRKSAIPRGSIVFFRDTECPNDAWRPYDNARGRYVVALNQGGVLGATVGNPLEDKEQRAVGQHSHVASGVSEHTHVAAVAGNHTHTYRSTDNGTLNDNRSNFAGGAMRFGRVDTKTSGGGGNHTHQLDAAGAHNHNISNAGEKEGTNAPYIQLLACEKIR